MEESLESNGPVPRKPILLGGEDAMEEDETMPTMPPPPESSMTMSDKLLSRIITPSPYAHHTTGATASRFRNAMNRVATDPTSDIEAWQAIITEATTCYRTLLPTLHAVDAETHAKLDWIESCFGTLLKNFPYASMYYVTIVEILLAQSARVGEEEGPLIDYGRDPSQRAKLCEAKVDAIFRDVLGVDMDGTHVQGNIGGLCTSSVDLWLLYIRKRVRDAHRQAATLPTPEEKADLVRQWSIDAYEVAIKHASFVYNNHLLWKQYLTYVKSWAPNPVEHALAQKQMIQLRSVYQRLVTHPMTGLDQLWQEYEAFERQQSEALAASLIAEFAPKYQHARSVYLDRNRVYSVTDLQMNRLATPPVEVADEDYASKMREEHQLLTLWKKRCAYERTNPERLTASELVHRVRQAYKEMACALTLHPEVWHMWAMWELLLSDVKEQNKVQCAVAVLHLGQQHIPDCTLLAYAEAQLVELHSGTPTDCIPVMERFLDRSPNTLGFVLYQQMVRRYKGMQPARAVFAKARRVLVEKLEADKEAKDETKPGAAELLKESAEGKAADTGDADDKEDNKGHRMVTNRLDASIGAHVPDTKTDSDFQNNPEQGISKGSQDDASETRKFGMLTWQLYASHAEMEHRLNHSPEIAARVYELGLRKHASFLTSPQYVLRYAQLLLELQDTENLRALLSRAVTACQATHDRGDALAALWDMTLKFEAFLSGTDAGNVGTLASVERRRHAALAGADVEDVCTGGLLNSSDAVAGVGGHKSSVAEQLVRSEGYDTSSSIVNGLGRTIDVLAVVGVLGSDYGNASSALSKRRSGMELGGILSGGRSDICFQRRLNFQRMTESGSAADAALMVDPNASKGLSARERLQQVAVPAAPTSAAAAMAIQQSPEWLRPLLLLLPASRFRTAAMNKPPPHMIEMALSGLRSNAMPAERPADDKSSDSRKRKLNSVGDSSDEDNEGVGGGYGSQFRARQRARQMGLANQTNGTDGGIVNQ